VDGTKVLANASKHAAVSYEHAGKTIQQLDFRTRHPPDFSLTPN
jgi:hypothetical protein